jgi:hypothetical protein
MDNAFLVAFATLDWVSKGMKDVALLLPVKSLESLVAGIKAHLIFKLLKGPFSDLSMQMYTDNPTRQQRMQNNYSFHFLGLLKADENNVE